MIISQGDLRETKVGEKVKVIFSADATSMWKTAATRCDVYIDARNTPPELKMKPFEIQWSCWNMKLLHPKLFARSLRQACQLVHMVDIGRQRWRRVPQSSGLQGLVERSHCGNAAQLPFKVLQKNIYGWKYIIWGWSWSCSWSCQLNKKK